MKRVERAKLENESALTSPKNENIMSPRNEKSGPAADSFGITIHSLNKDDLTAKGQDNFEDTTSPKIVV